MQLDNFQAEFVLLNFPHEKSRDVADAIGLKVSTVRHFAYKNGLKKSEIFNNSSMSGKLTSDTVRGLNFRFKKGHIPANKGKKLHEYMNPETVEKVKKTCFKNGHLPKNTKEDGAISIRKDRAGRYYQFIRLSLSKWVHLHVHLYREKYGNIPKGYVVAFKDRNTMNCVIENLELITRKELMARNQIHHYPEEIKQTIRTLSKLKKLINGKEQNQ